VTPDSRQVVVGAGASSGNALVVLDRDGDALSLDSCWNTYGTVGCTGEPGMSQRVLLDVAVAADGTTIYAAGMGEALSANESLLLAYHRDAATGAVTRGACALGCTGGDVGNLLALAPAGRHLLAGFTRVTSGGVSTGYVASFALEQPPAPPADPAPAPAPPAPAPPTTQPGTHQALLLGVQLKRPGLRKVVVRHRLSAPATLELRASRRGKPAGRALRISAPAGEGRTVLRRTQLRRLGIDGRRFRLSVRAAGEAARTLTLPAAMRVR
jgi:hypothetical protein